MFRRKKKKNKLKSLSYWFADIGEAVEGFFDSVLDWW